MKSVSHGPMEALTSNSHSRESCDTLVLARTQYLEGWEEQFCNSLSSPYLVSVFSQICKPVRPPILERVADDLRLQRST
jgi:hypothetical protein